MAISIFNKNPYYKKSFFEQNKDSWSGNYGDSSSWLDQQGTQKGGGMGFGDVAGGVASAAGAFAQGAAGAQDPGRFQIDPYAGLSGSFQGLASGGVVGAIAGGIGGQIGTFGKVNKNLKALDTGVNTFSTDASGAPVYNASAALNAQNTLSELQQGQDTIKKAYDPGTIMAGAVFGTKKKLAEKERQMRAALQASQQRFNTANIGAQQQQFARQQYEDQLRRGNVYNLPLTYF